MANVKALTLAIASAVALAGCEKEIFLKPTQVNQSVVNQASVCGSDFPIQGTVLGESLLAVELAKWIIEGLTDTLADEIKKYTQVYEGSTRIDCNIDDTKAGKNLAFLFSKKVSPSELTEDNSAIKIPTSIVTDPYLYKMVFNPDDKDFKADWQALIPGTDNWTGTIVLSVKWVSYARQGETTVEHTVFDSPIAALTVKDGKFEKSKKKKRTIVGKRPPRSINSTEPQAHMINWKLTLLDKSMSATALRKIHKTLVGKSDDLTGKVEEELIEALGLDE